MIRQFVETLQRWGKATYIGFNSIDFDEEFLRSTLFKTLEYPYLTSTGGNTRGDLLGLARAANLYYPKTLKNPISEKGNAIYISKPESIRKIAKPSVMHELKQILEKVVNEGTGTKADIEGWTIAGKTGTAQVIGLDPEEEYIAENIDEKLRDHALFTAFAPIENPQVAIAIIVENAGSGSSKAAPLARELLDEYFSKYLIVPDKS